LKKDIKDARYGLEQLLRLRPVTFKWKNENGNGDGLQLGLIAQEVQKVVPEVVNTDATTGMLVVNYTALLPLAIKAVQEQQRVIEQQEARLAALERGRGPVVSSLFSGGLGGGVALGLLPLGLVLALRRRGKQESR
jgi:hypothetical protein